MSKLQSRALLVACLQVAVGGVVTSFPDNALAAGDGSVAVLGLETLDGAPESLAAGITDALRQRVAGTPGYRLVQGRDLLEVKLVFACQDEAPGCMCQAAKSLGAANLLFGNLKKLNADTFSVTLKLLDAERGAVESWTSDQITRAQATGSGLRTAVQKWVAALTGQSLPGTLRVQGGVIGAQVSVDGVAAGVLGADGLIVSAVAAGRHEIVATKPGYEPGKAEVTLPSGGNEMVRVSMVASAPTAPAPSPRRRALGASSARQVDLSPPQPAPQASNSRRGSRVAAWALAGSGLAAVAIGVRYSWLVHDANKSLDPYRRFECSSPTHWCDNAGNTAEPVTSPDLRKWVDDTRKQADRYQTYQFIAYSAGGALLITSAVFFVRGYSSPDSSSSAATGHSPQLALVPTLAPGLLGANAFFQF